MKKNKGFILVLAVGAAAILTLLGGVFFGSSIVNQYLAEKQKLMAQAMHNAEAGIERAIFELRRDFYNDPVSPSWTDGDINGKPFPQSLSWAPFISGVALNEGSYDIELRNLHDRDQEIWIRSTGTVGNVVQRVKAFVSVKNLSIYNTAVFAGTGQGNGFINGHAEIHGSVHLMGQGLVANQNALDMSGTAFLGNNYETMNPPSFLGSLPSIADASGQQTLNAELRVGHGKVSLSGASRVGENDVPANGIKETFDGVYVTDGFTPDPPTAVFSDNGWQNPYDLTSGFTRPSLFDPYNGYNNYLDYYKANAVVLNTSSLKVGTAYAQQTKGANSFEMDNQGNITINGIVYVDGPLSIGSKGGGLDTFTYAGNGAILAKDNLYVYGNLLARNPFPQTNLVAIMSAADMELGKDPQSEMTGLFFAEKNARIYKQTNIAGTVVGDTFTMDQVPGIFQVPATLAHLPQHIPGRDPFWVMRTVFWKKD